MAKKKNKKAKKRTKKLKRRKSRKTKSLESKELIFKVPKKWSNNAYIDKNKYEK